MPAVYTEHSTIENCPYINCSWRAKNSYMAIDSGEIEDCYWSNKVYHSDNVLDCFNVDYCHDIYECESIKNCYNCSFVSSSNDCSFSHHLYNCV